MACHVDLYTYRQTFMTKTISPFCGGKGFPTKICRVSHIIFYSTFPLMSHIFDLTTEVHPICVFSRHLYSSTFHSQHSAVLERAKQYLDKYKVVGYPHVALIDPLTGIVKLEFTGFLEPRLILEKGEKQGYVILRRCAQLSGFDPSCG